jgi:hypothetical protein
MKPFVMAIIDVGYARYIRFQNEHEDIYKVLEPYIGHDEAEEAADWCGNAEVGDIYLCSNGFDIWVTDSLVDYTKEKDGAVWAQSKDDFPE